MPNFWAIKIYYRNYVAGICRSYYESSDCFEFAKKSLFKSSYQKKKYLPKFCNPKKSWNWNFHSQKLLWSSLSLEIRRTPPGGKAAVWNLEVSFSLFYFLNTAKSIGLACKHLSMCHCIGWLMLFIYSLLFCYWAMLIPIIAIEPLAGIFCRSHSTGQNTGHYATDNFKNKTGGVS